MWLIIINPSLFVVNRIELYALYFWFFCYFLFTLFGFLKIRTKKEILQLWHYPFLPKVVLFLLIRTRWFLENSQTSQNSLDRSFFYCCHHNHRLGRVEKSRGPKLWHFRKLKIANGRIDFDRIRGALRVSEPRPWAREERRNNFRRNYEFGRKTVCGSVVHLNLHKNRLKGRIDETLKFRVLAASALLHAFHVFSF